jgi:hypothetical protein
MSDLVKTIATKMIDNPEFVKTMENKLKDIMKDGKITSTDIPHIMVIVVQCTNNLKSFNLTYDELTDVLEQTIIYLLNHFKVLPEENKGEIIEMIHSCAELVLVQPQVKNCLVSTWGRLTSCCKK